MSNENLNMNLDTSTKGNLRILESLALMKAYIGLGMAILSSVFIGASFILKKLSLIRLGVTGSVPAAQGGLGYLKDKLWWLGFASLGLGEALNFAAYSVAPAALVTPLGALSVIVTAVLSSRFLKENLNLLGKLGCLLCILGSTIIVIHSPKEESFNSLNELLDLLQSPTFIYYLFFVVFTSFLIGIYFGPKYGNDHVVVYIVLCSMIGSLSVIGCKCIGRALHEASLGVSASGYWWTVIFGVSIALCVIVQMFYLNKALDMFTTSIVTPVYYVIFTTCVIVASAVLFQEWKRVGGEDVLGTLCGFSVTIVGIFLLHAFKDMEVSLNQLKGILRPKRELLSRGSGRFNYGSGSSNGSASSLTRTV